MSNREEKKLARRQEAKAHLLKHLGDNHKGLYSVIDAAKELGLTADEVEDKIKQGELISIEFDGKKLLPVFQFEDGKMLPHKDDALSILRDKQASDEAIITFFLNPFNGSGVTVRDALVSNPSEELLLEITREAHFFLGPKESLTQTVAVLPHE